MTKLRRAISKLGYQMAYSNGGKGRSYPSRRAYGYDRRYYATVAEAAGIYGCTPRTFYNFLDQGLIPTYETSRRKLVRKTDLRRFISSRSTPLTDRMLKHADKLSPDLTEALRKAAYMSEYRLQHGHYPEDFIRMNVKVDIDQMQPTPTHSHGPRPGPRPGPHPGTGTGSEPSEAALKTRDGFVQKTTHFNVRSVLTEPVYAVRDAAALIGISETRLMQLIRAGEEEGCDKVTPYYARTVHTTSFYPTVSICKSYAVRFTGSHVKRYKDYAQ
jgi:hypothetical protein